MNNYSKSDPAFPNNATTYNDGRGMSLRDYFAGRAMQGFCLAVGNLSKPNWTAIAKDAYIMADAMLVARSK